MMDSVLLQIHSGLLSGVQPTSVSVPRPTGTGVVLFEGFGVSVSEAGEMYARAFKMQVFF